MKLRINGILSAVLWASATVVGCTNGTDVVRAPQLWADDATEEGRRFLDVQWDTAWMQGGADDTVLANPSVIRASSRGVYVLDRSIHRVTALDSLGKPFWSFGSRGGGPNEFQNPRDMRVDARERILIYDPDNMRVVALDPDGNPIARIPLGDVMQGDQMLPISESRILLATYGHLAPMVVLNWEGAVVARFDLPWGEFAQLSPVSRQGLLFGQDEAWGYGFSMGNGWFGYEGLSARPDTGRYVEHTPFPILVQSSSGNKAVRRLAQLVSCSACTIVLDEGTLYVHFGGETELMQRLVDTYEWESGDYLGTLLLPRWAETMDVRGRRFYIGFSDPYPQILALDLSVIRDDP